MARTTETSDRRPSPVALEAAHHLSQRARDRATQVRRAFIERADDEPEVPPLALLLRGGRGGQVRLKLLLAMLWVGAAPPHDVTYPARAYAALLDLRDPDVAGARRILDALSWLEEHSFVDIEGRPGHPSRVTLLRETGNGRPYSVPGAEIVRLRNRKNSEVAVARHRYIQIPASAWTSGWISIMSGPALAMFLVLLNERGGRAADQELWFSPGLAKRRFDLSEDTRIAGIHQLADAGLVSIRRRDTNPDPFAVRRLRNVYTLNLDALELPAHVPGKLDSFEVDAPAPVLTRTKARKIGES